jgi:hypothetical protein
MMTIQKKRLFASILFVLISFVCEAQVGGPPPPGAPPPPGLPIDGVVLLGLCFGLFYGVVLLLRRKTTTI